MTTTDSDRDLVAALDRLTEAVAALAARLPAEPPDAKPSAAEPENDNDAAQEPPVDCRVVSLFPAPGWTAHVRVGDLGHAHTPVVGFAVCRDGRVRVVVSDGEGNVRVVDGSSLDNTVLISPPMVDD
jgi:oxalate decarboxylase/phosphoglucose isomerase-like protein (cupin superfamily)